MIITRAPLRISFFGGGSDYPEFFEEEGGAVLASAIDKYCYVTASPFVSRLFDYAIRISYRKVELVEEVSQIEHVVFRECLKQCGLERDIELHTVADLPAFTGLGSSSTFTVALLHALRSFRGEFINPADLAREAILVERRRIGDKVGCQDQVLAAYGGFNLVEFRTETDFTVRRVPITGSRLNELQSSLVLVFTGIRRKAAEVVAKQLDKVQDNRPTLRVMRDMARRGYEILTEGRDLKEFGELLHEAWLAKRSLESAISNAEIDAMYETGRKAGALGGKLLGAGGGGFLLFFVPPEQRQALCDAFAERQVFPVRLAAPGSQVVFSETTT